MLSSISPLGERTRHSRWGVTVVAYLVGSVAGGAALGLLMASLGSLVPATVRSAPALLLVVALLLLAGLLLDRRLRGLRLPTTRRQVDEAWLARYRGWVYGVGFGAQLGFGVVTIVTSATVYAMALLFFLSGSPLFGLGLGVLFGVVRAAPVLLMAGVRDRSGLHQVFRRLDRWGPRADRLAQGSLAIGAAALCGTGVLMAAGVLTTGAG